jgi:hypothetical protein
MFLIPILEGMAPAIASAIGTELQDKAASAIKNATGVDINGPKTEVMQQMTNLTPDQQVAIMKENYQFYQDNNDTLVKLFAQASSNLKESLEIQTPQMYRMRMLGFVVTSVMCICTLLIIGYLSKTQTIDGGEAALLNNMNGFLWAKYSTIIDWLFGTGMDVLSKLRSKST